MQNGQTVKCNSSSGIVYKNEPKGDSGGTTIDPFDKTDVDDDDTLDDIIDKNTTPSTSDKGNLTYDVKDPSILQISENGKMTALANGTTEVTVSLDGQEIGTVTVTTEDGKIKEVTSKTDESDTENDENTAEDNNEDTKENKKSVTENGKNINPFMIFFIILIIILIIYIRYKNKTDKSKRELDKYRRNRRKNRKKNKRKEEKKNEEIS